MTTQETTAAAVSSPADLLIDREFEYLLNRMHNAGEADNPYLAGYAKHRRALFEYVGDLQRRAAGGPLPASRRVELTEAGREALRLDAELARRQQGAMPLDRALPIVVACAEHVFAAMGISEEAPPSLAEYSLEELLEAQRVVAAANDRRAEGSGSRSLHVVCDPRIVAALYVAHHFDGQDPQDCEPVAVANGNAVLVVRVPTTAPAEG